jgi:hypothetical protein
MQQLDPRATALIVATVEDATGFHGVSDQAIHDAALASIASEHVDIVRRDYFKLLLEGWVEH